MTLPGDELVAKPDTLVTRAITIEASAEQIWPWLIQIGYNRAGWYSYDWLEYFMGAANFIDGHRSAKRIVPELQGLKVGDDIVMQPQIPPYKVHTLIPNRAMVLEIAATSEYRTALAAASPNGSVGGPSTWIFYLEPKDEQTTRLIVRTRASYSNSTERTVFGVLEPGIFIMERGMMVGLREHVENYGVK